jgi:hypothetical protein
MQPLRLRSLVDCMRPYRRLATTRRPAGLHRTIENQWTAARFELRCDPLSTREFEGSAYGRTGNVTTCLRIPPDQFGCNRYSAATVRRRYYLGLKALELPSRPAPVASIDHSVPNAATRCCRSIAVNCHSRIVTGSLNNHPFKHPSSRTRRDIKKALILYAGFVIAGTAAYSSDRTSSV